MNENNGINPQPVAPVEPVAPVAPVEPVAPVAPVAPAAPTTVAPVTPVAPVAPAAPVTPVQPVAPVAPQAPVAPVQPVAEQPVAPGPAPAPAAPATPGKKNNLVFIIIGVVVLLAIVGVILLFVFGKKGQSGDKTTTTTTTTTASTEAIDPEIKTTTTIVPTIPNTTTIPRTTTQTRPTLTISKNKYITLSQYLLDIPSGFTLYEQAGGSQQMANKVEGASVMFVPIGKNLNYIKTNINKLYSNLQESGFKILDAAEGMVGKRDWILVQLSSESVGNNLYVYGVTELDDTSIVETYILLTPTSKFKTEIIKVLTNMIDKKTELKTSPTPNNGSGSIKEESNIDIGSSFAPESPSRFSTFDKLDPSLLN